MTLHYGTEAYTYERYLARVGYNVLRAYTEATTKTRLPHWGKGVKADKDRCLGIARHVVAGYGDLLPCYITAAVREAHTQAGGPRDPS